MHWYPRYVPVDAQRARTVTEIHGLRARGVSVQPIELRGRVMARGFWARHWCAHLESFPDYERRLPRGRPYVRSGSVCHLEIKAGCVEAMVVGSALQQVVVRVEALDKLIWKAIKRACARRVGSVDELLAGRLPDDVANVVTRRNGSLFPTPPEIELACDCPHGTRMCAHAAAVLYGIGSRLDDSPALLFRLRGVEAAELLGENGLPAPATGSRFTGEMVVRLRERTGFSVVDFATLLQVSAATVHRWESKPGPLTLRASTQKGLTALQREIDRQEA